MIKVGDLDAQRAQSRRPVPIVRLDGNNAAEGRRILEEAEIPVVEQVGTMDDAARRAAELPQREHETAIFPTGENRIIVQAVHRLIQLRWPQASAPG